MSFLFSMRRSSALLDFSDNCSTFLFNLVFSDVSCLTSLRKSLQSLQPLDDAELPDPVRSQRDPGQYEPLNLKIWMNDFIFIYCFISLFVFLPAAIFIQTIFMKNASAWILYRQIWILATYKIVFTDSTFCLFINTFKIDIFSATHFYENLIIIIESYYTKNRNYLCWFTSHAKLSTKSTGRLDLID